MEIKLNLNCKKQDAIKCDASYKENPFYIAYKNMSTFDEYILDTLSNVLGIYYDTSGSIDFDLFLINKIDKEYVLNVTDACNKDSNLLQILRSKELLKGYIKNKLLNCGFYANNKEIIFTRQKQMLSGNKLISILFFKIWPIGFMYNRKSLMMK